MIEQPEEDCLIAPKAARTIMGVSRTYHYELVKRGLCPAPVKDGRFVRFSLREVRAWRDSKLQSRVERGSDKAVGENLSSLCPVPRGTATRERA